MSEEGNGMTIRIPAPRAFADAVAKSPDARTAEVLRALHRAKGTIAKADAPTSVAATDAPAGELVAICEWLSKMIPVTQETAHRLTTSLAVLERVVLVRNEKLADFQRGQDGALRELRESIHGLKRQADAFAAWRAWWARHVTAFCLTIALLLAGGIGLAWRAHTLAENTHDILAQILENQEKAQATKAGKRR